MSDTDQNNLSTAPMLLPHEVRNKLLNRSQCVADAYAVAAFNLQTQYDLLDNPTGGAKMIFAKMAAQSKELYEAIFAEVAVAYTNEKARTAAANTQHRTENADLLADLGAAEYEVNRLNFLISTIQRRLIAIEFSRQSLRLDADLLLGYINGAAPTFSPGVPNQEGIR